MAYVVGDTVKLTCTFLVDGVETDPDTQELTVKKPSGATDTYSSGFSNPSTGMYSRNVLVDEAGMWHYRWEGTGAAPGVGEGSMLVDPSKVV